MNYAKVSKLNHPIKIYNLNFDWGGGGFPLKCFCLFVCYKVVQFYHCFV